MVQTITLMVNQSISQKAVPLSWKEAIVIHIFKSGSKTQVANYRPISILPIISKVAEKWIANQLIKHLNKGFTPLHRMQFGFRPNHSTETANCFLVEKIKCLLDTNPCVGAVFLDLKKAFDTVNHQVLLNKLTYFNFSTDAISWFQSYLSKRTQCVTIDGVTSPFLSNQFLDLYYFPCTLMISQMSVLNLMYRCMRMMLWYSYMVKMLKQ